MDYICFKIIRKYGSHSVRSATTSKVKLCSVPIEEIMQKAGWSNAGTFAKFYEKDIIKSSEKFAPAVLKMTK